MHQIPLTPERITENFRAMRTRQKIELACDVAWGILVLIWLALVTWGLVSYITHAPKAGGRTPPTLRGPPPLPPGPGGGPTVHAASRGVSARQGLATAEGTSPLPGEFGPKLAKPCLSFETPVAAVGIGGSRSTSEQSQGQTQRPARADQRHEAAKLPAPVGRVFRVTAYCPCKICCGRNAKGITASGRPAVGKIAAADWSVFPNGSRVNVPGYGVALVCDTGSAIKGHRLDVLFPTHQEALAWGVRYLAVKGE